ncbi:MAG: flagellar hook-associated protein FlgK [Desulfotomaculum sp.]|nr:flagellar hook-associated protein FlgK [Desulfotomaculum sp.]
MPGTFFGIEIARRGINVHRTALDTTGHNIANANTPGYTRQEAVIRTTAPYSNPTLNSSVSPGQLGTGVEVTEMRRIRDGFLDNQLRNSATAEGFWQNRADMAARLEIIFPEPQGRGIQDVLLNFFNDWHALNNTPQDPGLKTAVSETSQELAALVRQTYAQLEEVKKSIAVFDDSGTGEKDVNGGLIYNQIQRVNEILQEINELNVSIKKIIGVGQQPNDLLDTRDLLLDELAGFGTIKVAEEADGTISIDMFGQQVLDGTTGTIKQLAAEMHVDPPDSDGYSTKELFLTFDGGSGISINTFVGNAEGSLAGLEAARQRAVTMQKDLDKLAYNLAKEVANLHGSDIFSSYADPTDLAGAAENFKVDSGVINDPTNNIDGTKALQIARLRSEAVAGLDDATFEAHYQKILAEMGSFTKTSNDMLANQQAIRQNIESVKESVTGVSIDEELSKMIQFQYGYQASARVISVMDDMLDVIINRLF